MSTRHSLKTVEFCRIAYFSTIWKIQCKIPPKTKMILPPENIQ